MADAHNLVEISDLPLSGDLARATARSKVNAGQHNHFKNRVFADLKADVKKPIAELNDGWSGNKENSVKRMGHGVAPDSKTTEPALCALTEVNSSQQSPRASLFAPATLAGAAVSPASTLSQQARTALKE